MNPSNVPSYVNPAPGTWEIYTFINDPETGERKKVKRYLRPEWITAQIGEIELAPGVKFRHNGAKAVVIKYFEEEKFNRVKDKATILHHLSRLNNSMYIKSEMEMDSLLTQHFDINELQFNWSLELAQDVLKKLESEKLANKRLQYNNFIFLPLGDSKNKVPKELSVYAMEKSFVADGILGICPMHSKDTIYEMQSLIDFNNVQQYMESHYDCTNNVLLEIFDDTIVAQVILSFSRNLLDGEWYSWYSSKRMELFEQNDGSVIGKYGQDVFIGKMVGAEFILHQYGGTGPIQKNHSIVYGRLGVAGHVMEAKYFNYDDWFLRRRFQIGELRCERMEPNFSKAQDAIADDDFDTLKMLVERLGLDINSISMDAKQETLLHSAVGVGSVEMVKFLLTLGADPNKKNRSGDTPFDLAVFSRDKPCQIELQKVGGCSSHEEPDKNFWGKR